MSETLQRLTSSVNVHTSSSINGRTWYGDYNGFRYGGHFADNEFVHTVTEHISPTEPRVAHEPDKDGIAQSSEHGIPLPVLGAIYEAWGDER